MVILRTSCCCTVDILYLYCVCIVIVLLVYCSCIFYILFDILFQQTRESIVHRLLDVIGVPSMFRHHYETVAGPYMAQYCIHADKNLLLYVQVNLCDSQQA